MQEMQSQASLGELATLHPSAIRVFLRHKLDFCCGGSQRLSEACSAADLDAQAILAEIDAEEARGAAEAIRWDRQPVPELVEHILERYHGPLRADLPALLEAARKVEEVHRDTADCPRGLTRHLEQVLCAVNEHLAKEEQILFPAVLSGLRGRQLFMPVRVMMAEHEDHGADLRRTRELCHDFALPEEACGTWRALYSGLATVEAELMEHIHLENNVLFPQVLED